MSGQNAGRREFLRAAGGLGAFTILNSRLVRGSAANSAVRVGLLGCGRRGGTDAANILQHTDARLVALADLFQGQVDQAKQRFDKVSESKGYAKVGQTFVGPQACRELMESKEVDAVVIATPAYFHPEHLEAAVAARKHVYLEKPVAVDVAGAKRVYESGKKADGKIDIEVGLQVRSAPPFQELVRRIHEGDLGEIAAAEAHYYSPAPEHREWPGASGQTLRLRNWIEDRVLSGDIIVEQNIHVLDICNWVLKGHPVKAVGRGGTNGRGGPGDDCYSHFDVVFVYAGDVHLSFNSTQFGQGPFEASERFFGTRGASQSPYNGPLGIVGEKAWTWEGTDNLAQADAEKTKTFIDCLTTGAYNNQAASGAEASLTAILGRQAAYSGREVTWEEMLRGNEHWDAGIDVSKVG